MTPGTEMYDNFSLQPEAWRSFLVRYQDRILFGTDNGYDAAGTVTEVAQRTARYVPQLSSRAERLKPWQ